MEIAMGILEFFALVIVVVLGAALTTWVIGFFAPDHPTIIDRIVWGLAVMLILWALVSATGLLALDPKIPSIR